MEDPPRASSGAEGMFPVGVWQPHQGNAADSIPVLPPPIPSYEQMCNASGKGTPAISRSILRALGLDDQVHNDDGEEVSIEAVMGGMKRRKKSPRAPKRPLSAYNLFFRDQRARVRDEGLHNHKTFEALGKFVAEEWKKLPFAAKQRYEDLEEQDRRRYHAEMAVFNEALELGIVHELPTSGGDVKDSGSEMYMEQRGVGSSISPCEPPNGSLIFEPPSVLVGGAAGHENQFAAPERTHWVDTPMSDSGTARPKRARSESAQTVASGCDSWTDRSQMELSMGWQWEGEHSELEQQAWLQGTHEEEDHGTHTLGTEEGASRGDVGSSGAVSLDPPRSSSSSPCWPAMNLNVAQQCADNQSGYELEKALRRYVEILQQSVQLANLRQHGTTLPVTAAPAPPATPQSSPPAPTCVAPMGTSQQATVVSRASTVPPAVAFPGLPVAAMPALLPALLPAADALQEQLLMQLRMLQEQSLRQQDLQRLTPTYNTTQQQQEAGGRESAYRD